MSLIWNNPQVSGITSHPSHHTGILVLSRRGSGFHLQKLCSGYREEDTASLLNPTQAASKHLDPSENNQLEFSFKWLVYIYIFLHCLQPLEDVKILWRKYLLISISSANEMGDSVLLWLMHAKTFSKIHLICFPLETGDNLQQAHPPTPLLGTRT